MKTIIITILVIIGVGFAAMFLAFLFFVWNSSSTANGATVIDKNISNQFYYKGGGVVYVGGANFFSLGAIEIEHADTESFKVLSYNIAKDKNHVYYNENIIENADPKTFELISDGIYNDKYKSYIYTKDAKRVFYFDKPIKGADPSTYGHLWGSFSKDAEALFYDNNKILTTSKTPFQITNDSLKDYLRVGDSIYYQDELMEEVDSNSFTIIEGAFAKDTNAIYFQNRLLADIDPTSFKILNEYYQRDKNRLYYKTKAIFESDPDSYEFINALFSKDKHHLYYLGSIVLNPNAKDYGTRKINQLENGINIIHLVYDTTAVVFVKKDELIKISEAHSLYKDEIYSFHHRIIGADSTSFMVFENCEDIYAADKNNVFYNSQIVKGADIHSFEAINSSFAKDKNNVYYFEKPLLGIDPDTFIYKEGMYGEAIDNGYSKLVFYEYEIY